VANKPDPPQFSLLLSAAGIVAGFVVLMLGQQLNGKIYEFASAQGPHFQETFGHISTTLLAVGGLVLAGSLANLVLVIRAGSPKSTGQITEVLNDCGIEHASNPAQSVKTFISQLKLDLIEAKKRERAIIEKAVDVICVLDINAKFLTVSKACQNAWGYSASELEGRSLKDLLAGENNANILNSILGSANSIDKIIFECKLKRKDERVLDVVWTAHWSASDGGLFCIVHDISERKYAERLLKNSETRLRRTLRNLPVGVLMVDSKGTIEFVNTEAGRMLARSPRELTGVSIDSYFAPSEKRNVETGEVAGDSPMKRGTTTATRGDGSTFPVEVSESVIEVADEQKTIVVFLDKTAEQELERVKREFVAMITHEIRTPISSVYGILALLEEGALGEMTAKGKKLTGSVKVTCKRIISLINDLLDLEKIQAGKFTLERKQVSVRFAMDTSLDNVISLAGERNITIDLPQTELCCYADEDRLVQVIVNLISNAIKYSDDNSTIKLGIEDSDGGFLRFSVLDRGRGIPEDKIGKIFDQFEQVELADATKKGGTGLGLAICHAIVKEHGGDIGVISKPNEGSCFWFTMPVNGVSE
jgi:PAS domain S-box-containing protein